MYFQDDEDVSIIRKTQQNEQELDRNKIKEKNLIRH